MEEKNLQIIFEDASILVLNKPYGLVVNKSDTATSGTLQHILEGNEAPEDIIDPEDQTDFQLRSGIVHRLDKDTSGVLVIAKTPESFLSLQTQFKERTIEKEYVAVVCGNLKHEILDIDAPIKRNPKSPMKMAVVASGREAQTRIVKVKPLEVNGRKYTVINCFPKTGRTHQIRVHCAAINHPIASDPIYTTLKVYNESHTDFPRLMLHAHKLTLNHPETNERMTFEAVLPGDFDF